MKIVDKTESKETTFKSLDIGDVFKYGGKFYIKTYSAYAKNNALLVYKNILVSFHPDNTVIPCKAELHIIEKSIREVQNEDK